MTTWNIVPGETRCTICRQVLTGTIIATDLDLAHEKCVAQRAEGMRNMTPEERVKLDLLRRGSK